MHIDGNDRSLHTIFAAVQKNEIIKCELIWKISNISLKLKSNLLNNTMVFSHIFSKNKRGYILLIHT